jgi:hypothetical protein
MNKDKIFIALVIGLLCLNAKCSNKEQPTPTNPPVATNDFLFGSPKETDQLCCKSKAICHLLQHQIQIQQWKWTAHNISND